MNYLKICKDFFLKKTVLNSEDRKDQSIINNLPDELLLSIFSCLNLFTIFNARGTCRKWKYILEDPHLDIPNRLQKKIRKKSYDGIKFFFNMHIIPEVNKQTIIYVDIQSNGALIFSQIKGPIKFILIEAKKLPFSKANLNKTEKLFKLIISKKLNDFQKDIIENFQLIFMTCIKIHTQSQLEDGLTKSGHNELYRFLKFNIEHPQEFEAILEETKKTLKRTLSAP